ncbi:hypothetical protein KC865_00685 [Candidatus Kaiserbacteria bacterium]|nr:hypothetical protein [Candidatus Kaiserbacteria bacterium]USN92078.1 MAG: hypothetical protein H6782_04350 [Candidatus Nomurabacteria bacterium]
MQSENLKIGFIGQGWIGKHYADDFESRSYTVVRYSLEKEYVGNKEEIKTCRIVFVAVPTPTTEKGFDFKPVTEALGVVSTGSTVVIKSTILPGTTNELQKQFPELFILHSPEFLREATAAYDASYPDRNIIGIPENKEEYQERASEVMKILPKAKYETIMSAPEAEMVKYVGNCFLYSKVLMMNIFYDLVVTEGGNWETVREAMVHDPRIGESHTTPAHNSGHVESKNNKHRGAGGHCFIKDFEAFKTLYGEKIGRDKAYTMLSQMIEYNNSLLISTGKDLDLLKGVYGDNVTDIKPNNS